MQYQSNKLFAATYGRGLWSIDLPITMPPTANFSYTDSIFCMIPSDVSFSNNSFYSNSYYWDFGDGNTSTLANPVHTYTSFGTFTVSLVAIGPLGTDTIIKNQIISIDPNNDCIFTLPPDSAGTILTMCSGTLYDVGGPNGDYYDNSYAWVTIEPPGSNQITLTFNLFDVEAPSSSSYCNWDYLEIFDGNDITAPSLGQYCNSLTGTPGTVISSGGAITILMFSDAAVTEDGFEADWTCTFPTSPPVSAFSVDSISCNPTIAFTDLSTNGPLSWSWDFGDGNTSSFQNPVHTYSSGGTYTVKLVTTNTNGADSIIINNAITIIDVSLQTFDNSSCGPDSLELIANSISGTINWYDDISLQNLLDTGNLFTTPILSSSTSYYVQSVYEFSPIYGGPSDNSIGNGNYNQSGNYQIFNAYSPCKLISVLVYANSDAYRTIELRDNQGIVMEDTTVFIPSSNNGIRIYLNFDIPVQNNMQLGLSGSNNDLFRNNSGAMYPYNIGAILSITGASNQSMQDNWYFLYDWEVSKPACISNIEEVTATIDSNSSNSNYVTSCGPYFWAVDGVTYTSSGIYTYVTTTSSGCTHIDTLNVTIGNNSSNNVQDISFCDGDSVIVGENIYYSPGSYIDSLETISGCDSIINTIVTVFPHLISNQNILLCLGDSVIVGSNTYTEEGSFVDTMISSNNCDSIVATIIEFSDIDAEIVWNNNQLEVNILSGLANNYLWSTGEMTSIITPNFSGVYWCLVTDINGCVSDTVFIEVGATTLFEQLKNSVKVFPNPTTGIVNIIFSKNVTAILNIQDVLGKDIYNDIIANDNARQVDLSDYSSGVYIFEFIFESHIITNKIILE